MSLNDTNPMIAGNKGAVYPGIANPTSVSTNDPLKTNFVVDPTDPTHGAGAGDNFTGHRDAARNLRETAGVCEGRPGTIESTNIPPLDKQGNDVTDVGWANTTSQPRASTGGVGSLAQGAYNMASSAASGAASAASGVAQSAYKFVAGDESARRAGKEVSA